MFDTDERYLIHTGDEYEVDYYGYDDAAYYGANDYYGPYDDATYAASDYYGDEDYYSVVAVPRFARFSRLRSSSLRGRVSHYFYFST